MKNRFFVLEMPVLILLFGLFIFGCDPNTNDNINTSVWEKLSNDDTGTQWIRNNNTQGFTFTNQLDAYYMTSILSPPNNYITEQIEFLTNNKVSFYSKNTFKFEVSNNTLTISNWTNESFVSLNGTYTKK